LEDVLGLEVVGVGGGGFGAIIVVLGRSGLFNFVLEVIHLEPFGWSHIGDN